MSATVTSSATVKSRARPQWLSNYGCLEDCGCGCGVASCSTLLTSPPCLMCDLLLSTTLHATIPTLVWQPLQGAVRDSRGRYTKYAAHAKSMGGNPHPGCALSQGSVATANSNRGSVICGTPL